MRKGVKELEKIITEQRNLFEYKFTQQEKQIINLENNLSNCVVNLIDPNVILSPQAGYPGCASLTSGSFLNLLVPIYLSELDFSDSVRFPNVNIIFMYINYEKLTIYIN